MGLTPRSWARSRAAWGWQAASAGCSAAIRSARPRSTSWCSPATFKAARTLACDEVTSFIREPFVRGHAHEGDEEPVETGDFHQALGELVTCSRCVGTWAAAGLATTQVLAPRFGRMLTWSLAAAGINDFLQTGFAALGGKANELSEPG